MGITETEQNKYKLISLRSFIFGYSVYINTYGTIIEIWTRHEFTTTCWSTKFYSSFWHLFTQTNKLVELRLGANISETC